MHPPTILIADDDNGLIRLLKTVLEPLGADIKTTNDATTALFKIHESPPDLVILDVNMPAGNGLSVCEMLATDAGLSNLPVIILSGEGEHARIRSVAMGAHYVRKGSEAMSQVKQIASQILVEAKAQAVKSQFFIG